MKTSIYLGICAITLSFIPCKAENNTSALELGKTKSKQTEHSTSERIKRKSSKKSAEIFTAMQRPGDYLQKKDGTVLVNVTPKKMFDGHQHSATAFIRTAYSSDGVKTEPQIVEKEEWKITNSKDKEVWRRKTESGKEETLKTKKNKHRDIAKKKEHKDREFAKKKTYTHKDIAKVRENGERQVTKEIARKNKEITKNKVGGKKEVIVNKHQANIASK